jgi:UDP-glucose-4-epimerase GalE
LKNILIAGGAGYIGSHTAKLLRAAGYCPVVVDDLSVGNRQAARYGQLERANIGDGVALRRILREHEIGAVIHFAASAYVGESIRTPRKYFHNNVINTLNLLDAMLDCGVGQIVFSSTCATYGVPQALPISEEHRQCPVNPYGESKLFIERTLRWYGEAYGLRWVALRYFNAAGADPAGELGECHDPETHLVPLAILAALGAAPPLRIFGIDYDTTDGTCVRDYIHVADLARAHLLALQYLGAGEPSAAFNLGTGRGHSVADVVAAVRSMSGAPVPVEYGPRRPGDPAALVADPRLANGALQWRPEYNELQPIIETAWRWHASHLSAPALVSHV